MGDPAALQEAIQRARQLAAKMHQSGPVKRPPPHGGSSDHSGPVKVTLAYEKPANNNSDNNSSSNRQDRHRSSSKDYNRNERDSRDRDYKSSDHRDSNHNQRESVSLSRSNQSGGYNSLSHHDTSMSQSSHQTQPPPLLPQMSHSSGPPASRSNEEKIELIIPHAVIGLIIGKGGENIKRIQNESGATVRVDPNTIDEKGNKLCTITGTKQAVDEAHAQVANVIENAAQNKRPRMQNDQSDSYRMKIPAHRTGAIIGKGGETIKSIKQQSGCEIELDKNAKECGPDESIFIIRGSQDKIQKARSLIDQRLARGARDGAPGGGSGSGGGRDHQHASDHGSSRNSRGVATGANAAPVAQYTDLPTPYSAQPGQPNTADMTVAWQAYMQQYTSMFSQPGAQPNAPVGATPAAAAPYGTSSATSQASLLGAAAPGTAPIALPTMASNAVPTTVAGNVQGQQQQPGSAVGDHISQQQQVSLGANTAQSLDYTDQWIQYYISNGRPDYAEQMMQLKKQAQQSAQQA